MGKFRQNDDFNVGPQQNMHSESKETVVQNLYNFQWHSTPSIF